MPEPAKLQDCKPFLLFDVYMIFSNLQEHRSIKRYEATPVCDGLKWTLFWSKTPVGFLFDRSCINDCVVRGVWCWSPFHLSGCDLCLWSWVTSVTSTLCRVVLFWRERGTDQSGQVESKMFIMENVRHSLECYIGPEVPLGLLLFVVFVTESCHTIMLCILINLIVNC